MFGNIQVRHWLWAIQMQFKACKKARDAHYASHVSSKILGFFNTSLNGET